MPAEDLPQLASGFGEKGLPAAPDLDRGACHSPNAASTMAVSRSSLSRTCRYSDMVATSSSTATRRIDKAPRPSMSPTAIAAATMLSLVNVASASRARALPSSAMSWFQPPRCPRPGG